MKTLGDGDFKRYTTLSWLMFSICTNGDRYSCYERGQKEK